MLGGESLYVGVETITKEALTTCSGNVSSSQLGLLQEELYVTDFSF